MPCTFDRPTKRRGVKAIIRTSGSHAQVTRASVDHGDPAASAPGRVGKASESPTSRSSYPLPTTSDPWPTFDTGWSAAEDDGEDRALHNSWKAFAIACDRRIMNLVQVYFEIVYPMYG